MRKTGKMLHDEARELLVESYEEAHNAREIAKIFGMKRPWIICGRTLSEKRQKRFMPPAQNCYKTGRGTYEKNLFNTMLVYHWFWFHLM